MRLLFLSLHLVSAGLWLGCVLTEVLFERALLGHGPSHRLILAQLHRRVDLWVELPAFLLLLVTGTLMLPTAAPTLWLSAKIGVGALAIAANAYCVWLVLRRAAAAQRGDWPLFERLDHAQHRWGAVVLLGLLGALALGIWLWVGGAPGR